MCCLRSSIDDSHVFFLIQEFAMSTVLEVPREHCGSAAVWPMNSNPLRPKYPSDLNDQQWSVISPVLKRTTTVGRPRQHELRDVLDAINYRWQTGCVWRMLPHDFPPWATVYSYFRDWQRRGVLRHIRETLLRPPRMHEAKPEYGDDLRP
jgi:transposase